MQHWAGVQHASKPIQDRFLVTIDWEIDILSSNLNCEPIATDRFWWSYAAGGPVLYLRNKVANPPHLLSHSMACSDSNPALSNFADRSWCWDVLDICVRSCGAKISKLLTETKSGSTSRIAQTTKRLVTSIFCMNQDLEIRGWSCIWSCLFKNSQDAVTCPHASIISDQNIGFQAQAWSLASSKAHACNGGST